MVQTSFIDDYEVKEDHGAKWLKIFHHDSKKLEFFDKSKALLSIDNNNTYSILKYLPYVKTYQYKKYEFLLEYPELPNEYNRWKQSSNPVFHENVYGYEANLNELSWTKYWVGLRKYTFNTFIGGCSKESGWWHFAIGAYSTSEPSMPDTFPGPVNQICGYYSKEVYLWVRVANFSNMICFDRLTCKYVHFARVRSIFIVVLILST